MTHGWASQYIAKRRCKLGTAPPSSLLMGGDLAPGDGLLEDIHGLGQDLISLWKRLAQIRKCSNCGFQAQPVTDTYVPEFALGTGGKSKIDRRTVSAIAPHALPVSSAKQHGSGAHPGCSRCTDINCHLHELASKGKTYARHTLSLMLPCCLLLPPSWVTGSAEHTWKLGITPSLRILVNVGINKSSTHAPHSCLGRL